MLDLAGPLQATPFHPQLFMFSIPLVNHLNFLAQFLWEEV
jgi:hypothetical protein